MHQNNLCLYLFIIKNNKITLLTNSNYGASSTASTAYPAYHSNPVTLPPPSSTPATNTTAAPTTHLPSYSQHHHRSTPSSHTDYRYHPYSHSSHSSHSHSSSSYNKPYSSHSSQPNYSSHSRYSQSTSNLDRYGGSHSGSSSSSYHRSSSSSSSSSSSYNNRYSSRSDNNLHSSLSSSKKSKPPRNEFGIPFGQPGSGLSKPDWNNIQLPKFQKNFYREAVTITQMTEIEVSKWREKFDIVVMGHNIPRPIRTFQEAGFPRLVYI